MNPLQTITALVPAVNTDFKCLGSECPDNCCTGWRVPIDQTTYQAYKSSMHPGLKPLFATKLVREAGGSPARYATIELKQEDHGCSFLEGGLCKIQSELGEEALSDTCGGYPRITVQHGDLLQQGLTLSCPDAANRVLLQEGMTEFVQAEVTTRLSQVMKIRDPNEAVAQITRSVRFFTLRILRQEHLAVWQRMTVLGFFCEEAAALQKNGDFASMSGLMDRYEDLIGNGGLDKILSGIGSYPSIQVKVFAGILFSKLLKLNSPHQKAVLDEFLADVFGTQTSMAPVAFQARVLDRYIAGIPNLERALADRPSFMANFLVNQMFNEAFPFNESSIFESYIRLVSRFGSLRMLLALQCSDPARIAAPERLATLTQVYARNFEHAPQFKDAINQALDQAGFRSMKFIAGIIRD